MGSCGAGRDAQVGMKFRRTRHDRGSRRLFRDDRTPVEGNKIGSIVSKNIDDNKTVIVQAGHKPKVVQ
jgi:hypothetical protein